VLDERLVGYWSDEDLYQGDMEAADIVFRRDGTGWTYWSKIGGPFVVYRFTWHIAADGRLSLALNQQLAGTWNLQGETIHHRVTSTAASDRMVLLIYEIRAGQDVLGRPATLLNVDHPIRLGTVGDRFALKRELLEDEQDPTTRNPHRGWR
jgi:hypothetical protein